MYVSAYLLANNTIRAYHASAHDGMLTGQSYNDYRLRETILVRLLKLYLTLMFSSI